MTRRYRRRSGSAVHSASTALIGFWAIRAGEGTSIALDLVAQCDRVIAAKGGLLSEVR
jgi:hypothetical protein